MKDIAKEKGLFKRGATFYARIIIPKSLQSDYKRIEIKKSLKTKVRHIALSRFYELKA